MGATECEIEIRSVLRMFVVVALCSAFSLAGCSASILKKPMFYDEDKKPVFLDDIFAEPEQRQIGREIINGDVEAVKSLRSEFGSVDFQGKFGITPLWLAVNYEHLEVVRYLLEEGASPNVEIEWVSSIVGMAAEKNPTILRALLRSGASVSLQSGGFDRLLPIHHASRSDFLESISMLVEAGADLNARSKSGVTPLLLAASSRKLDNVIYLLRSGADPAIANAHGATVVDVLQSITLNESNRRKAEEVFRLIGDKKGSNAQDKD